MDRSLMFDYLYSEASKLMEEYDPCKIKDGECERGRRIKKGTWRGWAAHENFCCYDCKYLTDNGCSVQALWCKLWVCSPDLEEELPLDFKIKQRDLLEKAKGLLVGRGSKEDSLKYGEAPGGK